MALITTPPVNTTGVPPASYAATFSFGSLNDFAGPLYFSGRIYYVFYNFAGVNGGPQVWMSTDNVVFTHQDSANDPIAARGIAVAFTLIGSKIQIALLTNAFHLFFITFDCATNTWGVLSPDAGVLALTLAVASQSSGQRYVFFSTSGAGNILNLMKLSSINVWSGPTVLVTAAVGRTASIVNAVLDTAETAHLFFITVDNPGSTTAVFSHISVTSAGVISVVTNIGSVNPALNSIAGGQPTFAPALGTNGTFAVPIHNGAFTVGALPQFVLGNPVDGWNISTPDPLGISIPAGSGSSSEGAVTTSRGILGMWSVYNTVTGLVDSLWGAFWNGVKWSGVFLIYDAITNPPASVDAPSSSQQAQNFTFSVTPNGLNVNLAFAMLVTPGGINPPGESASSSGFIIPPLGPGFLGPLNSIAANVVILPNPTIGNMCRFGRVKRNARTGRTTLVGKDLVKY